MTEYIPPDRYTPAAFRLAKDPNNADLRKAAQREEMLYDTVDHIARRVNRHKTDLAEAAKNRTSRDVLSIAEKAYAADVEYSLWQMVVQSSGPAMLEPLEALTQTAQWATSQALDNLEDHSPDLTDARIYARWIRHAYEIFK